MTKSPDNLFDFIDIIFDKKEYDKILNTQKTKHYFMINRFMSINWPIQAAYLGRYKINTVAVVDFWAKILNKVSNKTPMWMYVKTKKVTEKKDKSFVLTSEIISLYCKMNKCTIKEFNEIKLRWPDRLEVELKKLDELLKYKTM